MAEFFHVVDVQYTVELEGTYKYPLGILRASRSIVVMIPVDGNDKQQKLRVRTNGDHRTPVERSALCWFSRSRHNSTFLRLCLGVESNIGGDDCLKF